MKEMKGSVSRWYSMSELGQILAAAAGAVSLIEFPANLRWALCLSGVLFVVAIGMRVRASRLETALEAERQEYVSSGFHAVSDTTLATLGVVTAAPDIPPALADLVGEWPKPADEFIEAVRQRLGEARAEEKLDLILRYTRCPPPPSPRAADGEIVDQLRDDELYIVAGPSAL